MLKEKEIRIHYGEYKKIEKVLRMDHYDKKTKEAVFYLDNCKKIIAEVKEEEFVLFYAEVYDSKFPRVDPKTIELLVDKDSTKLDFVLYTFSRAVAAEDNIKDWKYYKSLENLKREEFLQELSENKFY